MSAHQFMTAAEVAEALRVSPEYVRALCASKQLRATKLGKAYRIDRADFQRFMAAGGVVPAQGPSRPSKARTSTVSRRRPPP